MKSVLIVDDDPCIRELICEILKIDFHVQIKTASSGMEAIAFLSLQRFDLVISDHNMLGGTGMDVLHFIIERKVKTSMILFTSENHLQVPESCKNFLGVVLKPDTKSLFEKAALGMALCPAIGF